MASYDEEIPDNEKVKIASTFIINSPPGEFNEVFNDVRVLLNNDVLLKEGASKAFSAYNEEQFMPVQVPGAPNKTLITKHGQVNATMYVDPRSAQQFSFDHLRKEAGNPAPSNVNQSDYRTAIDKAVSAYVEDHYPSGVCAVYCQGSSIVVCVEDHKFNPNNFWNGRWRSEWTLNTGSGDLKGLLKVQVHYYEDGNVQLISSKDIKDSVSAGSPEQAAKNIVSAMERAENEYQTGISENYTTMSDTTFKALRRQLPLTRTKLDWSKISSFKIGKSLGK